MFSIKYVSGFQTFWFPAPLKRPENFRGTPSMLKKLKWMLKSFRTWSFWGICVKYGLIFDYKEHWAAFNWKISQISIERLEYFLLRKKFAAPLKFLTAPQSAAAHSLKTTEICDPSLFWVLICNTNWGFIFRFCSWFQKFSACSIILFLPQKAIIQRKNNVIEIKWKFAWI